MVILCKVNGFFYRQREKGIQVALVGLGVNIYTVIRSSMYNFEEVLPKRKGHFIVTWILLIQKIDCQNFNDQKLTNPTKNCRLIPFVSHDGLSSQIKT